MKKNINEINHSIDRETLNKLREVSPSDFGHSLNFNLISRRKIQPVAKVKDTFSGQAVTVRIPPNDSVLVYKALEMINEGDVLVIDMSGEERYACWGEITTIIAKAKKVSGVIIQGPVTDTLVIEELGVPVFSTSISPLTTKLMSLDGDINVPVAIDDVVVNPGDVILGDNDGILVIPQDEMKSYLELGEVELKADQDRKHSLENGTVKEYFENLQPFFEEFSK